MMQVRVRCSFWKLHGLKVVGATDQGSTMIVDSEVQEQEGFMDLFRRK